MLTLLVRETTLIDCFSLANQCTREETKDGAISLLVVIRRIRLEEVLPLNAHVGLLSQLSHMTKVTVSYKSTPMSGGRRLLKLHHF